MGGEWWFAINKNHLDKLNVEKYQKKLIQIRQQFEMKFKAMTTRTDGAGVEVFWHQDQSPPEDNIFAKFSYKCSRPTCRHNQGTWYLYWDPKIVSNVCSDVYARCSPFNFTSLSIDVQMAIIDEFPRVFDLYLGDGIGGCGEECDEYYIAKRGFVNAWGKHPDEFYYSKN